jgi:uncharacterized protein (TIGR03067 family)
LNRIIVLLLFADIFIPGALAAPALKERAKIDSPILGEWREVSHNGKPTSDPDFETFRADGTRVINRLVGKDWVVRKYEIDTSKDPAHIDFIFERTDPKINSWKLRGIFKVEGDTLTLCLDLTAKESRPNEFTGSGNNAVWVYERVKPTKD